MQGSRVTEPESVSGADVSKGPTSPEDLDRAIDVLDDQIGGLRAEIGSLTDRMIPPNTEADTPNTVSQSERLRSSLRSAGGALQSKGARWQLAPRTEWRPGQSIWWDIAAAIVVVIVAGLMRYPNLIDIPNGIQGDEAQAALQAKLTWDLGWYGPWNPTMGGIPAGYLYVATPVVKIFGTSIESMRYLTATLDTITALLLFVFLRRTFGFTTAISGGLFYATSAFAILFGRTAFSISLWPLLVVIGLVCLGEALRSDRLIWWGAMAVNWGLAIYSYPGQSIYVVLLSVFLAWLLLGWRSVPVMAFAALWYEFRGPIWLIGLVLAAAWLISSRRFRSANLWSRVIVVGLAAAITMSSMAKYILGHRTEYLGRSRDLSIFRTDEWLTLQSTGDQFSFLWHRVGDYWDYLVLHPLPNTVDGSGAAPFVPLGMAILVAIGLLFGVVRRWNPVIMLGVMTIVAAPALSIWSIDFALRRSLVIMPFVAMFCGLAVTEMLRVAWKRNEVVRTLAVAGVVLFSGFVVWRNYDNFFNKVAPSNIVAWTFNEEFVDALRTTEDLPDGIYVYEWSGRWPWGMEVQTLLLPDTPGEWRGEGAGNTDLTVDYSNGRPVFMLFHDYQQLLPEIQAKYPGGEVIVGPPFWEHPETTAYTIYVLPEQP